MISHISGGGCPTPFLPFGWLLWEQASNTKPAPDRDQKGRAGAEPRLHCGVEPQDPAPTAPGCQPASDRGWC
jgi:hypothetical protein